MYEINENKSLLAVIGNAVYQGLCYYKEEESCKEYLNHCYGKNQKSNVMRAIVEYYLFKLGKANTAGIFAKESYNDKNTSCFLKMNFNDELTLTAFRLNDRSRYPKEAFYRGNFAKSNQRFLFPEYNNLILDKEDITYGIICFGIDKEGIFGYIGIPDVTNKQWVNVVRLEDYFTDYIINEEMTEEVLPKLKVVQVTQNG